MLRWIACLCVLFSLFGSFLRAQNTLNVPSPQYPTIQLAINAAQNSDTVLLATGTYNESIDFSGKDITVRGAQGAGQTVIAGSAGLPVVTIASGESSASVLEDVTIRGGSGGVFIQDSPRRDPTDGERRSDR